MSCVRVSGVTRCIFARSSRSAILTLFTQPVVVSTQRHHIRSLHATSRKCERVTIEPDSAGLISHDFIIDEEELEGYKAEHWYPVHLGQVFQNRYKVIGKLGLGSRSITWLCRDQSNERKYVTLKVCINKAWCKREIAIHEHLNSLASKHGGKDSVRAMLDSYEVECKHGKHVCLVYEPLGVDLQRARGWLKDHGHVLKPTDWRGLPRQVLLAMHFLHNEAQVVHTDIQPKNILMGVADDSVFAKYEEMHGKYL